MANNENKITLEELRINANTAVSTLNEAILEQDYSAVKAAEAILKTAVSDYNSKVILNAFNLLKSKSSPMIAAIEALNIAIIEAKTDVDKESKIVTHKLVDGIKQISLPALQKHCGGNIGVKSNWVHMVDKLCLLVTYRIFRELGQDTKKLEATYYISDVAKAIELGKTPMSNTALLKQVQEIVDAMVMDGDKPYKVVSHDVNYIVQCMTSRAGSGRVVAPRSETMHKLIMDMLHKIVTGGDYVVEFKTKRQADESKSVKAIAPVEAQAASDGETGNELKAD